MPKNPDKPFSKSPNGTFGDMINLNDESIIVENKPASADDSIVKHNNQLLESAQVFEQHVEQLTAWKHQLASQMELLRRDGVKLLERQKQLAVERSAFVKEQQATQQQRAAIETERQQIESLKRDLQTRKQELDQRALDLEAATEEINKLLDQKERYLHETAEAQKNLEALRGRQEQAGHQLEEFAKKADEMNRLESEKERWVGQIREAKATVDQLVQTQQEMLKHQQEISLRMAQFAAREKALEEREAKGLQQKVILSDSLDEIEAQRKSLVESELKVAQQQKDFQAQVAAHQAAVDQLQRQQNEFSAFKEQAGTTQAQQAQLASEVQSLRARIADLQSQVGTSEVAGNELKENLAAAQQTLAQSEQKITALQQQLHSTAAQAEALTQAQAQCRDLTEQISTLNQQAAELKAARIALETQQQQLQKQLDVSEAAAHELRKNLATIQTASQQALSQKEQEISTLRETSQQVQQALANKDQQISALQESTQQTLAQKEQEIAALRQRTDTATEQETALTQARAQCVDLTQQLAELRQRGDEFQLSRTTLESQLQDLRQQLDEQLTQTTRQKEETNQLLATHAARTAALEQQLQALTDKLAAAGTQLDAFEETRKQHAVLTENLDAANRQTQTLQTARAAFEAQIAELQLKLLEQVDSTELQNRLAEQKRRYEALVAGKQSQVAELQRLLELIQSQNQEGTARAEDVLQREQQTNIISRQLADAQREIDSLGLTRRQLDQTVADLQSKLSQSTGEIAALRQSISGQQAQHETAITEIHRSYRDQLSQERDEAQSRLEQAAKGADVQSQLEAQLAEYKAGVANRLREVQETYETKIAELTEAHRHAEEKLSTVQSAAPATSPAAPNAEYEKTIAAWEQRATELQTERDALLGTRVELEEQAEKLTADAQQSQTACTDFQRTIEELRQRCLQLEAEKTQLEQRPKIIRQSTSTEPGVNSPAFAHQRQVLLARVRKQRHRLWSFREAQKRLEAQWTDIAKQRDTLKSRGNSLEQVKRLLEKQELVMARKLADHGALKTVAAVGIFVIMILGATFFGVYQFVSPTYRSEAIVALPANGLVASDPAKIVRSDEAINIAWDNLSRDGYNVQAQRDDFAATLADNLNVQVDRATNRMAIRYIGPTRDGVAQVCNELAAAYAKIITGMADPGDSPLLQTAKLKALIAATAVPPSTPIRDPRFTYFLSWSAVILFASLVAVMLMRAYIYRQMREIDRMADEEDLENLKGDMPLDAPAA